MSKGSKSVCRASFSNSRSVCKNSCVCDACAMAAAAAALAATTPGLHGLARGRSKPAVHSPRAPAPVSATLGLPSPASSSELTCVAGTSAPASTGHESRRARSVLAVGNTRRSRSWQRKTAVAGALSTDFAACTAARVVGSTSAAPRRYISRRPPPVTACSPAPAPVEQRSPSAWSSWPGQLPPGARKRKSSVARRARAEARNRPPPAAASGKAKPRTASQSSSSPPATSRSTAERCWPPYFRPELPQRPSNSRAAPKSSCESASDSRWLSVRRGVLRGARASCSRQVPRSWVTRYSAARASTTAWMTRVVQARRVLAALPSSVKTPSLNPSSSRTSRPCSPTAARSARLAP
mmetsp:Transcript_87196/g.275365  ORF Transcript_87196/g.275365 Transcript_87196/m.275365 type:complete len:352 (+) Transcript_87196:123-1178(+)